MVHKFNKIVIKKFLIGETKRLINGSVDWGIGCCYYRWR